MTSSHTGTADAKHRESSTHFHLFAVFQTDRGLKPAAQADE